MANTLKQIQKAKISKPKPRKIPQSFNRAVEGYVFGRPSVYSQAVADEIITRVMEGQTLYVLTQARDMPTRDTIYRWMVKDKDFSDKYVAAAKLRRELKFESLEIIADSEPDVNRARLKVDVIKWQLSKEEPRKYGDKLDMTTNGKDMPTPILGMLNLPDPTSQDE